MKFLQCTCCNFLAVIPKKDKYIGLICPFCHRVGYDGDFFVEIDKAAFLKEADLVNNDTLEICKTLIAKSMISQMFQKLKELALYDSKP